MWTMKLRVSGLYRPGEHVVPTGQLPLLQLVGSWLADAGFPVEAPVEVEVVEPGRLVVTRVDEEGVEVDGLSPLVWIPAEQLGAIEESVRRAAESSESAEPAEETEAARA
jgi:hypothetical protein